MSFSPTAVSWNQDVSRDPSTDGCRPALQASDYVLGRQLGSGAFGTVYMAKHRSGKKFVVKKLDRADKHHSLKIEHEANIMEAAGTHPNLVHFQGCFWSDSGHLCLVLGYCEGGTLASLLKAKGSAGGAEPLPEEHVMFWFVQLLSGLHHLHLRNIIHRDLKPENIFLSANRNLVKLGDLGISKKLDSSTDLATTCLGTPYYMSPELMANRPYTMASDIWALGCVLYQMATRRPAFEARGLPQLVVKIMRNAFQPLPSQFSRPFQQLVHLMLKPDPQDRPSTSQLLNLPFVVRHARAALGQPAPPRGPGHKHSRTPLRSADSRAGSRQKSARRLPADKSDAEAATAAADAPARARAARTQSRLRATDAKPKPGTGKQRTGHKSKRWDRGVQYEEEQKLMAEMRYKAREFEQRMARQQAKEWRKEMDPQLLAKEQERAVHESEILQAKEQSQHERADLEFLQVHMGLPPEESRASESAVFSPKHQLARTFSPPAAPGEQQQLQEQQQQAAMAAAIAAAREQLGLDSLQAEASGTTCAPGKGAAAEAALRQQEPEAVTGGLVVQEEEQGGVACGNSRGRAGSRARKDDGCKERASGGHAEHGGSNEQPPPHQPEEQRRRPSLEELTAALEGAWSSRDAEARTELLEQIWQLTLLDGGTATRLHATTGGRGRAPRPSASQQALGEEPVRPTTAAPGQRTGSPTRQAMTVPAKASHRPASAPAMRVPAHRGAAPVGSEPAGPAVASPQQQISSSPRLDDLLPSSRLRDQPLPDTSLCASQAEEVLAGQDACTDEEEERKMVVVLREQLKKADLRPSMQRRVLQQLAGSDSVQDHGVGRQAQDAALAQAPGGRSSVESDRSSAQDEDDSETYSDDDVSDYSEDFDEEDDPIDSDCEEGDDDDDDDNSNSSTDDTDADHDHCAETFQRADRTTSTTGS